MKKSVKRSVKDLGSRTNVGTIKDKNKYLKQKHKMSNK